ncbi:MAG: methylmalonyl Co-A mutase-associated GTPase MeaB [Gammaproteobacteria bacterium]|nr:methylmalonyl Co-A mutase-associated GTPase MeaB [Gammaproteobacteria bacterium]
MARSLAEGCGAGERAALARAISVVEDRRPGFRELLAEVAAHGRRAHRTGITGPPGAGKSTLAAALAGVWRDAGEEVAIVAVDPTSPYSGGALLGDRVRMAPLQLDRGVFIRSMATRGAGGGLAEAVHDVIDLMEGSGFGRILLETVGVGQTELGVAEAADTVVVVLTPESGDEVQAMKAGLAEVADIFVVNKADRPEARALVRRLRDAVGLGRGRGGGGVGADALAEEAGVPGWNPPVLTAVATAGEGIIALADAIEDHRRSLAESGVLEARRIARAEARIRAEVRAILEAHLVRVAGSGGFAEAARMVAGGRETVYEAAQRLLAGGGIVSGGLEP